jgi:hypothetical protein
LQACLQPDLFEADRLILGSDFSGGTVCSPVCSGKKTPQFVVGSIHPAGGSEEAVGSERVGTGIQQPGSMSLVLGWRIDYELIDRALLTTVGVVILVATRTRKLASGGRSMAVRQDSIISASDTELSINSARSDGHWVAQERRCSSAMLAASAGHARRTEGAIGSPGAAATAAMVSGL